MINRLIAPLAQEALKSCEMAWVIVDAVYQTLSFRGLTGVEEGQYLQSGHYEEVGFLRC